MSRQIKIKVQSFNEMFYRKMWTINIEIINSDCMASRQKIYWPLNFILFLYRGTLIDGLVPIDNKFDAVLHVFCYFYGTQPVFVTVMAI